MCGEGAALELEGVMACGGFGGRMDFLGAVGGP
jgi:hypothetical protein